MYYSAVRPFTVLESVHVGEYKSATTWCQAESSTIFNYFTIAAESCTCAATSSPFIRPTIPIELVAIRTATRPGRRSHHAAARRDILCRSLPHVATSPHPTLPHRDYSTSTLLPRPRLLLEYSSTPRAPPQREPLWAKSTPYPSRARVCGDGIDIGLVGGRGGSS